MEMEHSNYENIEYCKHCGGIRLYYDKSIEKWVENINHRNCTKIAKFEKLSIFDKKAKENTFINAKIVNSKENGYIREFRIYCNNFEKVKEQGIGIILFGNAGTGKTFYSNCIINELKAKGYTAISFNIARYFTEIKTEGFEAKEKELLEAIEKADITVIDDIGSEILTDWGKEKIFNLFNTIYLSRKSVIITTNMTPEQLNKHFLLNNSDKVIDRIRELCKPYIFDWDSRRASIGREKFLGVFEEAI